MPKKLINHLEKHYPWTQLAEGRSSVASGRWLKIKACADSWILRDGAKKPMWAKDKENIHTVDDLLDYSGKDWDIHTLRQVFHESDV